MLGQFATTSRLTPIQQMSLAVLSRAARGMGLITDRKVTSFCLTAERYVGVSQNETNARQTCPEPETEPWSHQVCRSS